MNKYHSIFILFFIGFLFGVVSLLIYNQPSEVVQEWKNESNTLILSVQVGGVNHGIFPFDDYHRFFLSPFANSGTVSQGTSLEVSTHFSDYKNLKVEWLEDGCLITSKNGYKIFMPYP